MVLWRGQAAVFVGCEQIDAVAGLLVSADRRCRVVGVVKTGERPEGVQAAVWGDEIIVISGDEAEEGKNGSITLSKLTCRP